MYNIIALSKSINQNSNWIKNTHNCSYKKLTRPFKKLSKSYKLTLEKWRMKKQHGQKHKKEQMMKDSLFLHYSIHMDHLLPIGDERWRERIKFMSKSLKKLYILKSFTSFN